MVGTLAMVTSTMCVSLRGSCRNRYYAESIYHSPRKSLNRVSLLQIGNHVSSPSPKCNSLLRKRHYGEISRGIVKSAASSGKKFEPFLVVV